MRYKKTIKDNILTIENLQEEEKLYVKIFVDKYCCNQCKGCQNCQYELVSKSELGYCEKTVFTLSDGNYNIVLSDNADNVIDTFEVRVYTELRAEVVDHYFKKFCESSECGPCGGSSSKNNCKELAYKALLKDPLIIEQILTYSLLKGYQNNPVFMEYLQGAFDFYRCGIVANDCNQRKYLKFFGKYNEDYDLFGKLAAIYMVGFYLMELLENNESNLDTIYRICELKKCINKYGITFEKLESIFKTHLSKATVKPVVKDSKISIDLDNSCKSDGSFCIDGASFIDKLGRYPSAIRITSLPTSGNLFIRDWEGAEIGVVKDKEYKIPIIVGNCAFTYYPNETSNRVNPFDNFTFQVRVEEELLGETVLTDFSDNAVIEIFTNTLSGDGPNLNHVEVTNDTSSGKMPLLKNYMLRILGNLEQDNLEFIRIDHLIHSVNVNASLLTEGDIYDMKDAKNQKLFFGNTTYFTITDTSQNAFLFIKFSFKSKCSKYWMESSNGTPFIIYNYTNDGTCGKNVEPNWVDTGENGCSISPDAFIESDCDGKSKEAVWDNTSDRKCDGDIPKVKQIDINPCSDTYNTERWVLDTTTSKLDCRCAGKDTSPKWVNAGNEYCKGKNLVTLQKDTNKCSKTYNQTREFVIETDSQTCVDTKADWVDTGDKGCSVSPDTYVESDCAGKSTESVWKDTSERRCNGNVSQIKQVDTNTCSATYNTGRWVTDTSADKLDCSCSGKDTSPKWVNVGNEFCKEKNLVVLQKDTNKCSKTYGQTKEVVVESNSQQCKCDGENTQAVWADSGSSYCNGKDLVILQKDTNPCSSTFNTSKEKVLEQNSDSCKCEGESTEPNYSIAGSNIRCGSENQGEREYLNSNPCYTGNVKSIWKADSTVNCEPVWEDTTETQCSETKPKI